jgi:hypothetical protein
VIFGRGACTGCARRFHPGERIFQLARGSYPSGFVTPTYDLRNPVIAEWHERCPNPLVLAEQFAPYACVSCRRLILNGEIIVYGSFDSEPGGPYMRPERRAYSLFYVAHDSCHLWPRAW